MYMMSFFAIPRGVLKKLDYFRSMFFWQSDNQRRKYRLAKWSILCQPKEQGGLGIHNLELKNTALLSKWLFKLLTSDGIWQQIIRNKYLGSKPLSQVYCKKWGLLFLGKPHEGETGFPSFWLICNQRRFPSAVLGGQMARKLTSK